MDDDVRSEIEQGNLPIDSMVSESVKFVDGSEEQDLAVARYFIDKGCSEKLAGWLVREGNTRKAAEPRTRS